MKLKLIKERDPENKFDNTDVEFSADIITLDDAAEVFEDFLKACGFSLKHVDIITGVEDEKE